MMSSKGLYRQFCDSEQSLPLFSQSWWLDAVCGEGNWDAAVAVKGGEVFAVMPYYVKRKYGFKLLHMPPLTSMLGPWIRQVEAKYERQIGYQKEIMTMLIEQLPAFDSFFQSWHYRVTNWLPFYWKGFHQSTAYTYVIEGIRDRDRVWNDLRSEIRTDIRKFRDRFKVDVSHNGDLEDIIRLNRAIFARQGIKVPFDEDVLRRLDLACQERNCRKILIIQDERGDPVAGVYVVWDNTSAYYLVGGKNPDRAGKPGVAVLLWEMILHVSEFVEHFDFEGSMLEPVELNFRSFGGRQKEVFTISRSNSYLLSAYRDFSSFYRSAALHNHRRA